MKNVIKLIIVSLFSVFKLNAQQCPDYYGTVVISEVYFDSHYCEDINSKYHHFGEFIELYNSSNVPVDLNNWVIKDNHTKFKLMQIDGYNPDLIIKPGGYKIIIFDGFYARGVAHTDTGAQSEIGARNKFIELFPDIVSKPGFTAEDIILQTRVVLYNLADKLSLFNQNEKLIDEISYHNGYVDQIDKPTALDYLGILDYTINISPSLFNDDGGVFNGKMGEKQQLDGNSNPMFDLDGNPIMEYHPEYVQAIYRKNLLSYYDNNITLFDIAEATPFSLPFSVPLLPLDPFIYDDANKNYNYTEIESYDILTGSIVGQSKSYFDQLGRSTVSLTKDFKENKIWGSEQVYDSFGRPFQTSFPATTCFDFDKVNFLSSSGAKTTLLDQYYSNTNTDNEFQATATHPYSETNYDKLNPGNVINVVGGNQINGEWKTGYSYTVPAAQEMYYVYGYNYLEGIYDTATNKEEVVTKFYKNVSVDANGIENVSFSDGEGRTLAVARSGAPSGLGVVAKSYPVYSLIGTQGYVDIHIPAGAAGGNIFGFPTTADYTVFDLKTGVQITPTPATLTSGKAYRIVANIAPTTEPKIYVFNTNPATITYSAGALGISYNVNYYDYTINVYDKTGRLTKNVQANGFNDAFPTATFGVTPAPAYMLSTAVNYITNYKYDTLGQLIETTNPDEGKSKFAYRNDGQIRYSQSAIQVDTKVSYTNYDEYVRPIESGIITGATGMWALASNPVNTNAIATISGTKTERVFTVYDYPENNTQLSITIPPSLSLQTLLGTNAVNYVQTNLAGNVAITYKADATTVNSITWYSYDIYGRAQWLVQYNEGIGVKTIDYEYDYKGNITNIFYQKNSTTDYFAHQYTYDFNGNIVTVATKSNTLDTYKTDAEYSYTISGELKRVNIAQGAQGIDYAYTLGGALKSINHPSLEPAKDPGRDGLTPGVAADLFGITLDYYKDDYKRLNNSGVNNFQTIVPQFASMFVDDYVGNIKATRWANRQMDTSGSTINQKAYMYSYDKNYFLSSSNFGVTSNTTGITTANTTNREHSLAYDSNGNIKMLRRSDQNGTNIDILNYQYSNTTPKNNQLRKVDDAVTGSYPNDIDTGQITNNYVYNAIGQLITNTQEQLTYIYNTQGLTTEVKRAGNSVVKFFYNERGNRVRTENFVPGSSTLASTDYYISDVSGNVLSIYNKLATGSIAQIEMPIYGASRIGVAKKGTQDIRNYQITDHLGNVRAVIQKNFTTNSIAANLLAYADYYPFGEQLPTRNSNSGYRYAYQGQEKIGALGETGMEAFQLRLWDGRLGRWMSPDPYGQYASPYLGMGNNPISSIDTDGGWETKFGAWWHSLWDGKKGEIFKDETLGDWGVFYAGDKSIYNGSGISGSDIQEIIPGGKTTFGGKRYDNINSISNVSSISQGFNSPFFDYGTEATFAGDYFALKSHYRYNETFWKGRNGTYYSSSFGGNGTTGGKLKFGKSVGATLGKVSTFLGVYSVFSTQAAYRSGEISTGQMIEDQTVNGVGFLGPYGAAANLGWSLGSVLSKTEIYNRYIFGVHSKNYQTRGIENGWLSKPSGEPELFNRYILY